MFRSPRSKRYEAYGPAIVVGVRTTNPSNKIRLVLENEHRKTVRKKSNAKYQGRDS